MKRRLSVIMLLILPLALVVLFRGPRRHPEPVFQGRSLTEWVLAHANNLKAPDVSQAIGTNGFPCLVAWLSADPESDHLRGAIKWFAVRLPNAAPFTTIRGWADDDPAVLHFELAAHLFFVLGPDGAPAIPELEHLAGDARGRRSAYVATLVLAGIGEAAIPALQRIAAKPDCPARAQAAGAAR
ncbi:MAG TPA: hypothetical protein VL793_15870, partial [Patescibacteria group bacterium]|nr:hypothetical protein [Patescibacteria group bacterium]